MIKMIKTEADYEDTLQRVYNLIQQDIELNTPQADELDLLTTSIERYEEEHYPLGN